MAGIAERFFDVAAHPEVAPLARDRRAAIVLDRSGTRVLWANAAGLAALGGGRAASLKPLSVQSPTARRIAALAGRLTETPRAEKVPLPLGIVPVQAVCAARRITVGAERLVLLVVIDGTALIRSEGEAGALYDAIAASLRPAEPARDESPEATVRSDEAPAEITAPENAEAPDPAAELAASEERELADEAGGEGSETASAGLATDSEPARILSSGAGDEPAPDEAAEAAEGAEVAEGASAEPAEAGDTIEAAEGASAAEETQTAGDDEPSAVAVSAGAPPSFVFAADGRTVRFVFELDAALSFRFVSPEFAETVGPRAAELEGRSWSEVAEAFGLDPRRRVAAAMEHRDTFTGLTVEWPVENEPLRVPVDLAGMPVFGRDRAFRGYRGFGLARAGAAVPAPAIIGPPDEPFDEQAPSAEDVLTAGGAGPDVEPPVPDEAAPREPAEPDLDISEGEPADAGAADLEPALPDEAEPTVPPGAEEAEADDLGADWSGSVDEVADHEPPPETDLPDLEPPSQSGSDDLESGPDLPDEAAPRDLDVAAPAEPPEDDGADLDALAALDGAGPEDIANAGEPPDVDPAAPDAADDVGPHDLPPAFSGEVIPSPMVKRHVPTEVVSEEERNRRQLSRPEREAFQKIAEALGARLEEPYPVREAVGDVAETKVAEAPSIPIDLIVLDRLPVAVAILKNGEAVTVNKAFLDLAGYPDRQALAAAGGFAEAFDGSTMPRDASLPAIRRRDGVEVPVSARLHSIPWQDGIASLLVLQETAAATGRDRAEAAEARVDELEAILDTATDGVLVLDARGTVLGANRSAEALFGTDRSHMVGDPVLDLLAPESHRAALDYLDGLARNGVASVLNDGREVIGRVRQGGLVPLFMTMGRISADKFCAVLRDITQWKRAEEELTNAKRSAETASSQKSDFLAKISHEIRTPLNAIIGFSEVMMEERFGSVGNDRYKEYLRDIHLSGAHIMSLVNDLLDLSKIEAGKLDLAFEAVPVNEVIRECVALMQPQANRERVIIRTSLSSSLPDVVADSRSIRQIVLNLVSNAIKFNTPGGQVIVSTLYEDSGEVAIRIRDTGPGMTDEDIGKALEPFRQLHTTRTGRGTGLGLPLTKALVEANRAAFRIESAVGQGTLVHITFPSTRVLAE